MLSPETDSTKPVPAPVGGLLSHPRRWLRSMYDWTISWSAKRSALGALFAFSFAESSVFPIPPDPLLMAIAVAKPRQWRRAAALCTAGSVLGGLLGYVIGWSFMAAVGQRIVDFYGAQHHWDLLVSIYTGKWGVWFLAVAAFTPIPYKVATIAAGATSMAVVPFAVTSLIGRGARFFLVAGLLGTFGPQLKEKIERHFDWLSLVFIVLIVVGFLSLKLILPALRGH